jgi:serpin B
MNIGLMLPLVLTLLAACTSQGPTAAPEPTPVTNETLLTPGKAFEKSAAEDLPFKLYQALAADPKDVCLSPLSLEQAFSMIYLASQGATRTQMESLFGFKNDEVYHLKQESLGEGHTFSWGNSIWLKPKVPFREDYLKSIKEKLGADSFNVLEPDQMNEWISNATKGKIERLVDSLDPRTISVFINAFYLKAPWQTPFQKADSLYGPFQSTPSKASQVVYLSRKAKQLYFEDDAAIWLELPYSNRQLTLLLALPKKKLELRTVEDRLSHAYLKKVVDGLESTLVDVKLPKFKLASTLDLGSLISGLGYSELFSVGNYSKMTSVPDTRISKVLQATQIQIDENGTEAAAATAATMETTSFMPEVMKPKTFHANQPFIFVVRNPNSGKLYFLGRVFDPKFSEK